MLLNSEMKKNAIARNEILYDAEQRQRWIIGSCLGIGDVGEMYEAALYDGVTNKERKAVVQIEPYGDGTPSTHMQFYIDNASPADIHTWKKAKKMSHLGIQALVGSGTHQCNGQKYRFIVLEGYGTDLWSLLVKNGRQFPEHTVYKVASQVLPALEYIHSRAQFHGAVEGANMIVDWITENCVFLVNLNLGSQHVTTKGTRGSMEYMSRDAHAGVSSSRGDLESLLFNMIRWLCGTLPWEKNLSNAPLVQQQKEDAFKNTEKFLKECFKASEIPIPISEFMQLLFFTKWDDKPKYQEFSKILIKGLNKFNCSSTDKLEFSVKSFSKTIPIITCDKIIKSKDTNTSKPMITSTWKLIKPKNANTNQQCASISDSSKEDAAYKNTVLSKNPALNASAAPEEAITSNAELPKQQDDRSTQFKQKITNGNYSRANNESYATDKYISKRVVRVDNNNTHEGSEFAGKAVRFSKPSENIAMTVKKIRTTPINSIREPQKSPQKTQESSPTSLPPDVNTNSRQRSLQCEVKAAKREPEDDNVVPPKRSRSNTESAEKENSQLDDSGIVVDDATSKRNSNLPAAHNTLLHDAVNAKNLEEVKLLLEIGVSICDRDVDGNTALHLAFLLKNKEIVDVLLSAMETTSSYENVKDNVGLTTLHIACTRNNSKVIKNLLESNADLKDSVSGESSPWKGFTALHFAAKYKSVEAMKILVKASSKSDLVKKNGNGETALEMINKQTEDLLFMSDLLSLDYKYKVYDNISNFHVACARDDPNVVKSLLEKGAPIDTQVYKAVNICAWYAPVHFAVKRKCTENVRILVENGADLTKINHQNMTPLHQALYTEKNGERTELVDLLYRKTRNKETNPKDKDGLSYLHVACTRNDADLVTKLLDKNEDVNSRVDYTDRKFYNYTPLHFATYYNNADIVRLLIERGAAVNACDGAHSGTPLHIAFDFGFEELIEILLSSGANPKAISPLDKLTMLHYLVDGYVKEHENNEEALLPYVEKLIFEFGVDVDAKDHEGDTALHIACEQFRSSAPVAKLLLEFGADINVENHKGETPFMWALHGHLNNWQQNDGDQLEMLYHHVKKLLAFGLEVNEKNEMCCEQLLKKRRSWRIENLCYDLLVIMEQERRTEVEEMKRVELRPELSLYDFAKLEPERYNEVVGLDFHLIGSMVDEFPNYGYLIKLQLRKINVPDPQAQVDQ